MLKLASDRVGVKLGHDRASVKVIASDRINCSEKSDSFIDTS